jgi:phospholipid-binding lipoprotein MlaA
MSYFSSNHKFHWGQYYIPQVVYFIQMRAQLLDADSFLQTAYDPYAFVRDAWRQNRLNKIYDGNPPADVIEQMQGLKDNNFDPDELLNEQHQWEKSQSQQKPAGEPASKPSQH